MSNNIRQFKYVHLSQEQMARYIEEARQVRNDAIKRGVRQVLARLRYGLRALRARVASLFRPTAGKGTRAPRAC